MPIFPRRQHHSTGGRARARGHAERRAMWDSENKKYREVLFRSPLCKDSLMPPRPVARAVLDNTVLRGLIPAKRSSDRDVLPG